MALVTGQVAMATVLLVGAGLLATSFVRLATVEKGYSPDIASSRFNSCCRASILLLKRPRRLKPCSLSYGGRQALKF